MDVDRTFEQLRSSSFTLYGRSINPRWAKLLKTLGLRRSYVRAEGPYLFDDEGNRYLDMLSGWGVFAFGRNHPEIRDALRQVLDAQRPDWVVFDTPPLATALAEALKARVPYELDYVYFCNSGTECTEAAIKFARACTKRPGIVYLEDAFHGLTMGALSVNGDETLRTGFGPFLPGAVAVPRNDLDSLERVLARRDVAAFLFEPIQGKGVHVPEPGYLRAAQALCRKYGALTICDEVQTGIGRTGKFLAAEWEEGLEPDVVLLAKALSGGAVPVGAVLMRKQVFDAVYSSMQRSVVHGCTFGMGNLAMAAGLASLDVLFRGDLMHNAERMGARLAEGLRRLAPRFEMLGEVRQRGLMLGIELRKPTSLALRAEWNLVHAADRSLFPQAVVLPLFDDHRILTQAAGYGVDVVKLLPPLTISEDDVDWFLSAFEDTLHKLHRFPGPVWELLKKLGKHAVASS